MINRIVPAAILGLAMISLNACTNKNYKKTKDGLEYKIVKDAKGDKKAVAGDVISMHIIVSYKDDKVDTVLMDSRKVNHNEPIEIMLGPVPFKGAWEEGLTMLTPGDSASFRSSVDSLMKADLGMLPPFMKKGQKVQYDVVLVSIKSKEQVEQERQKMEQEQQAHAGQQREIDDKALQEYLASNNITAQKTASGIYYTINKQGSGPKVASGQTVTVNYTGKTLDGETFDSNVDPKFEHVQPFEFAVGQGMVIPGWDEGLMLLNKGSKATLYIPSTLAYGPRGNGPIPPNAILKFDIELTGIK
jgi:FKBP-type peptidyl-prolyl cis-trans isomerase FkpA